MRWQSCTLPPLVVLTALFLLAPDADAQSRRRTARDEGEPAQRFGDSQTQRWQVGVMVTAPPQGNCQGVIATVPVPTDWPEQQVKETQRETTPHVTALRFRIINGGVKQMIVVMPAVPAGQTAQAVLTYEITRRDVIGPEDPSGLAVPRRLPRDVSIYLGTSPLIESRDDEIRDLCRELTADKESDWAKAEAIYDWVRTNITYQNGKLKGALAALRDRTGDCEERTSLFVALCRAADIPARTVWIPDHSYPEFYLQDQQGTGYWFPCEITSDQRFFGTMPARFQGPVGPRLAMVLQKGDNFKVPGERKPQRYVAEHLEIKNVTGVGDPEVRFIRKVLDE